MSKCYSVHPWRDTGGLFGPFASGAPSRASRITYLCTIKLLMSICSMWNIEAVCEKEIVCNSPCYALQNCGRLFLGFTHQRIVMSYGSRCFPPTTAGHACYPPPNASSSCTNDSTACCLWRESSRREIVSQSARPIPTEYACETPRQN